MHFFSVPADGQTGSEAAFPAPEGITPREFFQILHRRRKILLLTLTIVTASALIWTFLTKPVYQAVARLLVEAPSARLNTGDSNDPFSEIFALAQPQSVDTQVEQLQSPALLETLEDNLHISVTQATDALDEKRRGLTKVDLAVKAVDETNVITVTGESTDPQKAAAAADTLLRLYIDQDVDQSKSEIQQAIAFALGQVVATHRRLDGSERAIERFKLQNHITDLPRDREQRAQQVATLAANLQAARVTLAALRTQLGGVRRSAAGQAARQAARIDVTNPAQARLQDRIADLQQKRAALTQEDGFTDRSPDILALDAQIAALRHRLVTQPALVQTLTVRPNDRKLDLSARADDLAVQAAAQEATVERMANNLTAAQAQIRQYAGWEVTLAGLLRQHDQAALLDTLLTGKLADLRLRLNAHHASKRIDEAAQVPRLPIRPRKALNLLLGAVLGLFAGIGLALLQEYWDDRIHSAADADRLLGLSFLGDVPTLGAADARLLPLLKPHDPAADRYRVLRTNIQFASLDRPIRSLLITSTAPHEGKTTTAANIAFAIAAEGTKVIIVETDLRRPALHRLLGVSGAPGLTDVLLGNATLDQALRPQAGLPNMHLLPAGSMPPSPADLLNSLAFKSLVDDLKNRCDLVLFDSPPVLAAADAAILAAQMDGTVFVVEPGKTRKGPAREAIAQLRSARASLLGIAYNKMPPAAGGYSQYWTPSQRLPAQAPRAVTALATNEDGAGQGTAEVNEE